MARSRATRPLLFGGLHRAALRHPDRAFLKPKKGRLSEAPRLALTYAQLGQTRQARRWLEEAEGQLASLQRQRREAPGAFPRVGHAWLALPGRRSAALRHSP